MNENMQIHLRPRLQAAADLLFGRNTVADVGCDHGRLACAMLQQGGCKQCIATDISALCLEKTKKLAEHVGVGDRLDVRAGDGLKPLATGEADAVAILGMGGTLMARLLDVCEAPLAGAKLAVLQPMRAYADIRRYLFEQGYVFLEDRVVLDAGRLYQLIAVAPPDTTRPLQKMPPEWPADCYEVGFLSWQKQDPLLPMLAAMRLAQYEKRLQTAAGKPTAALLFKQAEDMRTVLRLVGGMGCC